MVIQGNMSPKAIVDVWEVTEAIFDKHEIPHVGQTLEILVEEKQLHSLLQELNAAVGSSTATCIGGG